MLAATVVHGLLGAWYAIAVPPLHAPDEFAHVDLALHGPVLTGFDTWDDLAFDPRIEAALPLAGLQQVDWRVAPRQPWPPGLGPGEVQQRGQRPALDDLADDDTVGTGLRNPAGDHPPLAYWVYQGGDAVLDLAGDTPSWDTDVLRLRLLSVLVGLPTPWLAAALAWQVVDVGRDRSRRSAAAVAAALLCSAVPQATHMLGAVNNDVLLVPLGALALLLAARLALGDTRAITVVALGAVTGLTQLVKVFGLLSPLWVGLAVLLAWRRGHLASLASAVAALALAGAAHVVAGGFWPLRQLLVEGTPAPRGFAYPTPEALDTPVLPWLGEVARRMTSTTWGHFGVEQFRLPWLVLVPATAIAVVLLVLGARLVRGRTGTALLLALPALTTCAMIGYAAWGGYARSGIPSGLHGRYVFVGLAGLVVLAAAGATRLLPARGVVPAATLAVVTLQAVAVVTVVPGYWAGDGPTGPLRTLLTWSPVPGPLVVLAGLAGGLALVLAAVLGTRDPRDVAT